MNWQKYTHVLWDFNGTVYDDMDACLRSVNEMLATRELPLLTPVTYREVFDFPVKDYYARIGFDFTREPFEVLAPIWVAAYERESQTSGIFPGVKEAMEHIRREGLCQEILSATEETMLGRQLRELGLDRVVDGYFGTGTIHAGGKVELAQAWRAAHPHARVVLIGDTTHDAHVASVIGADCILFDGGHMSRRRLMACGVEIISSFGELML